MAQMFPRSEVLRAEIVSILSDVAPSGGDGDATRIALYSMFSALGVALLTGLFALLVSRYGGKDRSTSGASQYEAWERWFLLHDIDPRRITSGFESMEEVRRVVDQT